jgi:flagellar protein FliL
MPVAFTPRDRPLLTLSQHWMPMSGSTAPTGEQANAEGAPTPATRPAPIVMIGVLAVAVAAGIGGGFVLAPRLLPASGAAAPETETEVEAGEGKHEKATKEGSGRIFRLDNLIVNPAGSEGTRFLMATVAFEVESETAEAALKDHDVQVRDLVVSRLESQTMQMLTQPAARDSIKHQLALAVAPLVGPKTRVRVYLPQFVIQ